MLVPTIFSSESFGDLLCFDAGNLGDSNSIITETTAIWKALPFCRSQGYQNIILETDSFSLNKILRRE